MVVDCGWWLIVVVVIVVVVAVVVTGCVCCNGVWMLVHMFVHMFVHVHVFSPFPTIPLPPPTRCHFG